MEIQICSSFDNGNFRFPAGAVETSSKILFEIEIPRSYGLKEVNLVWINDYNNYYDYIKMNWKGIKEGRDVFTKEIEVESEGIIWYYFQLKSIDHVTFVGKKMDGMIETDVEPPAWQITIFNKHFKTPDWIKGGIFYHIFVDRFAKEGTSPSKKNTVERKDWGGLPIYAPNEFGEVMNNDFFGGNLKGIIAKLDYIQSLGVNCIYLSPIFEAFSNHKYDTGDFTKIDPMFGTLDDFKQLCEEAKQRGIRVILDGVFNHTGSDSIYFNKKGQYESLGAYQSKDSPYYSWFSFSDYPDQYECWWGIDTLPAVNESNPSYVEFISGEHGVGRKWLQEGASGWRLDVVDELPDGFLEQFRSAVKSLKEDALIIGEVWEDASHKIAYGQRRHYFEGKQLDSVMNYPFMNAIIQFIRYGDAENIHDVVTSIYQNYPNCVVHCLMNMICTHDTRRILTALGGKGLHHASKDEKAITKMTVEERKEGILLLKLAALIQMTLPGVPCIYYGDEVGMEGYEDPFNRRCYPWGEEEQDVLSWYKTLGNIRKQYAVFKEGTYKTIISKEQVYFFERTSANEKVIIGVNRSTHPFQIDVENVYQDVLHNKIVKVEYILEPNEGCILVQV